MTARIPRSPAAAVVLLALIMAPPAPGQQFPSDTPPVTARLRKSITAIVTEKDPERRGRRARKLASLVRQRRRPLVNDSTALLLFEGEAHSVSVPGDMNGWTPSSDTMQQIPDTRLWYRLLSLPKNARVEYKFLVDGRWILDPFNRQHAEGGLGTNSELCMPGYRPPTSTVSNPDVPHGTIDTLDYQSRVLSHPHPVFIYHPGVPMAAGSLLPVLVVTDGGDYLRLGLMNVVLDNLIGEGRIRPIIVVFVDPRTDLRDPGSNRRMEEYALNDRYVAFLSDELLPDLRKQYPMTGNAEETVILGCSMGGLIATYAAVTRPAVFGAFAAQSPSYWWEHDTLIAAARHAARLPRRCYIDTGTFHDAREGARTMRDVLTARGSLCRYGEFPEGHNWSNWRSHLETLLTFFWDTH